ncbi:MAG: response regulator transcription factor, partial [Clostridium sp.]
MQKPAGETGILLVEDDKEIREGIEIFLRGQGYRVFQAADGLEGLEVLKQERIDLAIVDIMMPRMDGVTMVVKLRETFDFPVIFLSAKSEEVDKIMGLNMGADDYITKPFTPMELLARVNSQLRRYRRFLELLERQKRPLESENIRSFTEKSVIGGQMERETDDLDGADVIYRVGGLELNESTVEVFSDGSQVRLTP